MFCFSCLVCIPDKVIIIIPPHVDTNTHTDDLSASKNTWMAKPTTYDFLHAHYISDINNDVCVANNCIPTSMATNGIVCRLSPWEGVWIFMGANKNLSQPFGGKFGVAKSVFPLTSVKLDSQQQNIALQKRFIVQTSLQENNDFFLFLKQKHIPRQNDPMEKDESSGEENEDVIAEIRRDMKNSTADFPDELLDIAVKAIWKNKKKMMKEEKKKKIMKEAQKNQTKTEYDETMAYISFDDHQITTRLQNNSWNPHFGVLKLIPLVVVYN